MKDIPDFFHELKNARYAIGIDPGTKTGFAVYNRTLQELVAVETMDILEAMDQARRWAYMWPVILILEDARKRGAAPGQSARRAQGAGSVKRDSTIWAQFCQRENIPMLAKAPGKGMTKMDAVKFAKYTGWTQRTSSHARDAAMLVFGM
jgi:hypothetical protein